MKDQNNKNENPYVAFLALIGFSASAIVAIVIMIQKIIPQLLKLAAIGILLSLVLPSCNTDQTPEIDWSNVETLDTVPRRISYVQDERESVHEKQLPEIAIYENVLSQRSKAYCAVKRTDADLVQALSYALAAGNARTLGEVLFTLGPLGDTLHRFDSESRLQAAATLSELATMPLIELANRIETGEIEPIQSVDGRLYIPSAYLPSETFAWITYDAKRKSVNLDFYPATFNAGQTKISLVLNPYQNLKTIRLAMAVNINRK